MPSKLLVVIICVLAESKVKDACEKMSLELFSKLIAEGLTVEKLRSIREVAQGSQSVSKGSPEEVEQPLQPPVKDHCRT